MAAFHQERIDNALAELELYNVEALPAEPAPMPAQAAACVAVYDGLINLCDTALNAIGHGLEEIRITCLDWRTSVAGIRDAQAQTAAADEYRQFMATADAPRIQKDARAKKRNLERLKTTFQVARQAEVIRQAAIPAAAAAPAPAAPAGVAAVFGKESLTTPNFSGKPEEFNRFWKMFIATVDTQNVAPVIKLTTLLSKLSGNAQKILSGVDISDAGYDAAKRLLVNRYGGNDTLIKSLRNRFSNLPFVQKPSEVEAFQIELEAVCSQLELLGKDPNNEENMQSAEQKLPYRVLVKLSQEERGIKAAGNVWDFQAFRTNLSDIVKNDENLRNTMNAGRELREGSKGSKDSGNTSKSAWLHPKKEPPKFGREHTSITFAAYGNTLQPRTFYCVFCGGDHLNYKCSKFATLAERRNQIIKDNRCFKCLKKGHGTEVCLNQTPCKNCKGPHATILCPKPRTKPARATMAVTGSGSIREEPPHVSQSGLTRQAIVQTILNSSNAPVTECPYPKQDSSCSAAMQKNQALLMTTRTQVFNTRTMTATRRTSTCIFFF